MWLFKKNIIIAGACGVVTLLYVTLCVIYWIKYLRLVSKAKQNRNTLTFFVKIRHLILCNSIFSICLLVLLLDVPYSILVLILEIITLPFKDIIHELLHTLLLYLLLFCIFIKFYLLYYNMQLSLAKSNLAWQTKINANVTDWYIQNCKRWGNPGWIIKICSIPYVLIIVCINIVTIEDSKLG